MAIRPGTMTSCARAGGAAAAAGRWGAGRGDRAAGTARGRAEALRPGCGRRDVRGRDPEKVSSPALMSRGRAEPCFPLG